MFVYHYILAKKFNKEVYCFAIIKKEKQKKGKSLIYLVILFPIFLLQMNFSRKMMCNRHNFWRFRVPNCEKSFAFVVCAKCLVKTFQYAFVSKSCFSLQNIVFTIFLAQVNEKKHLYVLLALTKCDCATPSFDL